MKTPLTVDELLAMYDRYQQCIASQSLVGRQLARAKLAGDSAAEQLLARATELDAEIQAVSDGMTFDSPRIWIEYKYRAYQGESQSITTMHDFRMHCSKPGYICTARFQFLNDALVRLGQAPLDDRTVYSDNMELSELLASGVLDALDETTLATWREHEYHRDEAGRVAKWANIA